MVSTVSGIFVPVDVLARDEGVPIESVIERIKGGGLVGRRRSDGWQVLVQAPTSQAGSDTPADSPPSPQTRPVSYHDHPRRDVIVTNVRIPLASLVRFFIQCVLAVIPAMLMAYLILRVALDPALLSKGVSPDSQRALDWLRRSP